MRRNNQPIRRRKRLFIMPEKSTSKHIKKALKAKYAAYTDNKIEIIIFMSKKYMSNRLLCGLAFLFM